MKKLVALYSLWVFLAAETAYICYWLTLPTPVWKTPSAIGFALPVVMAICIMNFLYMAARSIIRKQHPIILSFSIMITVASYITAFSMIYKGYGLYATHCLPGDQQCLTTPTHSGFIALYFLAITLSTVGYGDYIPADNIGRSFAATEALSGYFLNKCLRSRNAINWRKPFASSARAILLWRPNQTA